MKNIKIAITILIFIIFHSLTGVSLYSQKTSTIAGIVRDKSSSEPLISVTVMLEGTKFGTRTNKLGFYSIPKVPDGDYNLLVRYVGYKPLVTKIKIKNGVDIRLNLELEVASVETAAVYVTADREVEQREITISKVNIPVHQIKEIRVGGESDVFRTLQFLPGVLTSSQISNGLYVRGGSPDQNLVMIDGATVYNPSHLFGFFSTFNTNAIKDVEFIKGGFDAEYGSRLSSVLNITQKDGNKKEIKGEATVGLISSQAGIEIPVGDGAFFVSGRRTYLELITPLIPVSEENPLPKFFFYDVNAKVTQDLGDNDKVSLSGFISKDRLDFSGQGNEIEMRLNNQVVSGRWTHIFSNDLFLTTGLSYSKYQNFFVGGQTGLTFSEDNSISDFTVKSNLEWFIKDNASVKAGLELNKYEFNLMYNFTGDTTTTAQTRALETKMLIPDVNYAAFVQSKINITEYLSLQSGLRFSHYKFNTSSFLDPRLSLRYMLTGNVALKAAWGIYHQGLRLAGMPNFSIVDVWLPSDGSVAISKSNHYIFSTEIKPTENLNLNFDLYYKTMNNIGEMNMSFFMQPTTVSDVLFIGNAKAYGLEVFCQKTSGRFTGWIGYGLGFIYAKFDSINRGQEFRPKYDRRHDFKAVLQYKITDDWEVGGTFTLQSGQSYTGATSRSRLMLPGQSFGISKISVSQLYGLRLPLSHQLNLYGAYSFKMWGKEARVVVDIYNVYNRRDILMRMYNTRDEVVTVEDMKLLPIIPSISFEVKF